MKTVITYGVFDLFHEGHARLLERARKLGDRLIVGVTTEQYAVERGKLCVVDSLAKRIDNVRNCPFVDEVIVEDHYGQKAEDIRRYHADILAMGDDWLGKFDVLEPLCEVVYLERTPNISSSLLRNARYPFLRIGMIGAGRIAERFVREAEYVREAQIGWVYHPRPDASASLQRFLSGHPSIAKVRTLEKLFDQAEAIYIASPHDTHYDYARKALEAGRHVLCEKPMCFSRSQAEELFRLAEQKGLVLMEAVKTAYCPGFVQLCGVAQSGFIGEIVSVTSSFTRLTPPGCREWDDHQYGGSFTEFGSYVLLPAAKLLGTEKIRAEFHSIRNEDGLDLFTKVHLYGNRQMATGTCGLGAKAEGDLVVSGTRGYIYAQAPWWKTQYFEVRSEDPARRRPFSCEFEGDGLRYEIADFLYRVQGHEGREFKLTPEESIWMAGIMEEFLKER